MKNKFFAAACAMLLAAHTAFAQTFDANSATIDNPFCPLPTGAVWLYRYFGTDHGVSLATWTNRISVVGKESVNGIQCTKTMGRRTTVSGDILNWYAQDTDGNVWLVKHSSVVGGVDTNLYFCFPAALTVGDVFYGLDAQSGDQFTVDSTSDTVVTPAGVFNNCVHGTASISGGNYDLSILPGLGQVRFALTNANTSGGGALASYSGSFAVDLTSPTVTITSPTANQVVTNSNFTVVGRAGDNAGVLDVQVSTDGLNWMDATSGNNWTNWTADVSLTQGTNFIYAYAIDDSGNHSSTNKVKVIYNYINPLVPGSFRGMAILQTILNGDGAVFDTGGYTVVFAADAANTYQRFDLVTGETATGTYSYNQATSDALLTVNDGVAGTFAADYNFSDPTDGTYTFNQTPSGAFQNGNFFICSGTAPASPAGKAFYGTILGGGATGAGSWKTIFGTSSFSGVFTNADTTTESVSGNYTVSRVNASTFKLVSTGNSSTQIFYFSFTDPQNGYYFKPSPVDKWQFGYFTMQTAPETTPPTVTITSPTGTQVVSNSIANIAGTAHDNVAVAAVMYSTDGVNWTDANTSNGWTNWTANPNLNPGPNAIHVQAVDTHGNYSAEKIVVLIYDTGAGPGIAPGSLRGSTIFQTADSAASPFDYPNYGLVFFANAANTFTSGGVQDNSMATPSSGAYTYFPLNGDGFIVASNHVGMFTGDYTFSDQAHGNYSLLQPSSGGFQNGNFTVYSGTAPASLSGLMFTGQETDGANEGLTTFPASFWISFGATQFKHLDPADGNTNTGSYTYSVVNRSTGKVVANNNPQNVLYLIFGSPTSCAFAQHDNTGGWAVGSFDVTETIPPTVTFTAPTTGQRWSNDLFTVRGKASDNVAVADLQVSADGVNWISATPVNGWSNWTADVILPSPGTNTIYAYAVDTSGNVSATIHATMTYVLSAPLSVQTNLPSWGTIAPGYNNALLQIGSSYTMTAAAKPGFAFTNWTDCDGNLITNKPALNFVMTSNLCFRANFLDAQKPVLSITNLPASGKVSNELFTVKGKAGDNVGVANLFYNVNNNGWLPVDSGNGFTNWSGLADLSPGPNVILTSASDAAGNTITVTSRVTYVLSAPLLVQTNLPGWGTIAPAYNNALLQIGTGYAMTATAKPGFAFTNWTDCDGNLITNKAALNFAMASNLCFRANFLDVQKPTLSITNLPAGGKVSNELFIVKGKASDNVGVANVFYKVNNSGWTGVDSFNAFTNWTVNLDLLPGSNVITAYAMDAAGNTFTVTSRVTYVLSAPLTVQTNLPGWGTTAPGYNNALLQISNNYTMTAAAKPGFAFTNWTDCDGNVITNKLALNFVMASNLCFRANFLDVQKPAVVIVSPTATTIPAGEFLSATGKATDNVAVMKVWCQLNGGAWFLPDMANGWSNWNVTLDLVPGTNWFSAYAVDTSGNISPTNVVKFIYNTAPTSLNGLKAEVTPDGGNLFEVAFGATTFSQTSLDTNNVNGVGNYTYTRQSPGSGLLRMTYTAPPSATNDGQQTIQLTFTAPGVALFTNNPNTGGIIFTSTPTLVRSSLAGQGMVFVNQQGQGGQISFTAAQTIRIRLDHTTNGFRSYTYSAYSPLGGLVRETASNQVHYVVLNFAATNYGSAYSEEYDALGNLGMTDWAVFGLASQRPGGNAPTNTDLSGHFALLTTDAGANRINFTDSANFMDLDPMNLATVNGVGTYAYGRNGTNSAELDLNYTSPSLFVPLNLLFVSPNFAIFTNNVDATIGAMGFK